MCLVNIVKNFLPVSQLEPVKPCGQAQTLEAMQTPPFLQPSLQKTKTIKENYKKKNYKIFNSISSGTEGYFPKYLNKNDLSLI